MHLREYLHPRARSCSGRRVSSPPPTATFPRLPTPREHGLRASSSCASGVAGRSGVPELPCDRSHLPSVHDMGSFISRPVLIFRTILNRVTNGFVTAFLG